MITEARRAAPPKVHTIHLGDKEILKYASMPRAPKLDYTRDCHLLPPPNMKRGLLLPVCAERLERVGMQLQTQGVKDLKFIIVERDLADRHRFADRKTKINPNYLSTEVAVSYNYISEAGEITRIAGSPVISALHGLSLDTAVIHPQPPPIRTEIIRHHFGDYLGRTKDLDVSVIAIPARVDLENSPTHNAFTSYAVAHPTTQELVERANFNGRLIDLYFFAHGQGQILYDNIEKAQRLMIDKRYRHALVIIDQAWNDNFRSDEVQLTRDAGMPMEGAEYGYGIEQTQYMNHLLYCSTPQSRIQEVCPPSVQTPDEEKRERDSYLRWLHELDLTRGY